MRSEQGHWMAGRSIVAGIAEGHALVVPDGLSFAMGFDVHEGLITDVHSPFTGERLTGRILVMPVGRGSSSASGAFAEALRVGTGPAGIILREVDEIITIGGLVARTLYDVTCPIVVAKAIDFKAIPQGARISIRPDGAFCVAQAA